MNAMNYFWTACPKCEGELTFHFVDTSAGLEGSVRRWSRDRSTNDGRRLDVPRTDVAADGAFVAACVCGQPIAIDPARVTRATTERPAV
ncbi:MAG TPA: hypothetical protein VGG65_02290 [Thermoanaerobaculia bacterium]|jgi:hypothetical protein